MSRWPAIDLQQRAVVSSVGSGPPSLMPKLCEPVGKNIYLCVWKKKKKPTCEDLFHVNVFVLLLFCMSQQ